MHAYACLNHEAFFFVSSERIQFVLIRALAATTTASANYKNKKPQPCSLTLSLALIGASQIQRNKTTTNQRDVSVRVFLPGRHTQTHKHIQTNQQQHKATRRFSTSFPTRATLSKTSCWGTTTLRSCLLSSTTRGRRSCTASPRKTSKWPTPLAATGPTWSTTQTRTAESGRRYTPVCWLSSSPNITPHLASLPTSSRTCTNTITLFPLPFLFFLLNFSSFRSFP